MAASEHQQRHFWKSASSRISSSTLLRLVQRLPNTTTNILRYQVSPCSSPLHRHLNIGVPGARRSPVHGRRGRHRRSVRQPVVPPQLPRRSEPKLSCILGRLSNNAFHFSLFSSPHSQPNVARLPSSHCRDSVIALKARHGPPGQPSTAACRVLLLPVQSDTWTATWSTPASEGNRSELAVPRMRVLECPRRGWPDSVVPPCDAGEGSEQP